MYAKQDCSSFLVTSMRRPVAALKHLPASSSAIARLGFIRCEVKGVCLRADNCACNGRANEDELCLSLCVLSLTFAHGVT